MYCFLCLYRRKPRERVFTHLAVSAYWWSLQTWGSSQEVSRKHRSPWWPPGQFWQREWERYCISKHEKMCVDQMTWPHRDRESTVVTGMKRGDFTNTGLIDWILILRMYCLFLSFTCSCSRLRSVTCWFPPWAKSLLELLWLTGLIRPFVPLSCGAPSPKILYRQRLCSLIWLDTSSHYCKM